MGKSSNGDGAPRLEWFFRPEPADGGRNYGDAAGFAFNEGLRVLTREVGQNAGDAKLETTDTVRLELSVIELTGKHLQRFLEAIRWDQLKPHLEAACALEERVQVAHAIKPGIDQIESGSLTVLRIADFGTSGLLGAEQGVSRFAAVMRNTLDSNKTGDTAGGSYGLGKAVMWASSRFGLVLAASNLSEPLEGRTTNRLLGRLELPWHDVEEGGETNEYAGPGWLGAHDGSTTVSAWADDETLEILRLDRPADTTGTSFLVVGVHDTSGEAETIAEMAAELERGAAEAFWPAMVARPDGEPLLEVVVKAERNGKTESERVVDPRSIVPAKVAALESHYLGDTVDELVEPGDVVVRRPLLTVPARTGTNAHPEKDHDVVLLVRLAEPTDDSAEINRVAYMRGKLMIVKEVPVRGLPVGARPFHAVVLAGEAAEDDEDSRIAEVFLRAAEPPEHNDWRLTRKVKDVYQRGAKAKLDSFYQDVLKEIRELLSTRVDQRADGPDSLKELLVLSTSPPARLPKPRVTALSGSVDAEGAWNVEATVRLPQRPAAARWQFAPKLRFATDSGAAVGVKWETLEGVDRCSVDGGIVVSDPKARTLRFRGTTAPESQPVDAEKAAVTLAVVDARPAR
jgi:RNA polymerase primary sigma factor